MRIIAIANQKGGCGKTTTAINIATALAAMGKRILLIDFDPQAHTTLGLGYDHDSTEKTIYDLLTNPQTSISTIIMATMAEQLDLVPSNILLAGAELELRRALGKELVLGEQLEPIANLYDLCVIDCPPSLGLLMINALVASTDVLIPVQAHFYALDGLKRLLETIGAIRKRFHPCYVKPLGLLLTFVEDRTMLSRRIQLGMRDLFGNLVFDTVIHKSIALAEAPSMGLSILTYAPESRAAAEYKALAVETIARIKTDQPAGCET
jgi:chromosome partitioning protein